MKQISVCDSLFCPISVTPAPVPVTNAVTVSWSKMNRKNSISPSGKTKKKTLQLADLTPTGQELFEQLRKCRADLANERSVPPYIICSDKTLKDMCTKCPTDDVTMAAVYGMGVQKIASYGADFTSIISDFLKNHDTEAISSGDSLTMETDSETAPAPKKKKLPFYIAPEKLNLVELTDSCMLSELTAKTNTLCDDPARKKLTAAFVNQLLIEKGYLEELKNYFLGLL